jgi:hypothetical protein
MLGNRKMSESIGAEELQELWKFKASESFINRHKSTNLNFAKLNNEENSKALLEIEKTLNSELVLSGSHRQNSWESGWGQNLDEYEDSKDLEAIKPKYFGKFPLIRWKQMLVKPESRNMESDLLALLIQSVVEKHSGGIENLYEFGCGTGNNLVNIRSFNKDFKLYGLDWVESSQKIVRMIAEQTGDLKLFSANFNYFNPNYNYKIKENSIVVTVASLEQTGDKFADYISYLVAQRPKIVIHIEPMWEPLDPENEMDLLSMRYFRKRNYLDGLYLHLKELHNQGKVEIQEYFRSFVGSFFVDGYSVVVWKPNS